MEIQERVGRRIRERRQSLQRTQREVADAAGIGVPYLSNLEHGQKSLSLRTLEALARALGLSPADLLTEDPA